MIQILTTDQIVTAVIVLLAACGAVSAVGSAWGYIQKWRKPGQDMADTLEHHTKCLDNDNKRLAEQGESINLLMRGVMQLMTHEIDGNHVDKLREARDAMEQYLIER